MRFGAWRTSSAARGTSPRATPNFAASWPVAIWAWVTPFEIHARVHTDAHPRPRARGASLAPDAADLLDAFDLQRGDSVRAARDGPVDLVVRLRHAAEYDAIRRDAAPMATSSSAAAHDVRAASLPPRAHARSGPHCSP
jgi:predicted PhzF superfamily epimerase YddE/YHI9